MKLFISCFAFCSIVFSCTQFSELNEPGDLELIRASRQDIMNAMKDRNGTQHDWIKDRLDYDNSEILLFRGHPEIDQKILNQIVIRMIQEHLCAYEGVSIIKFEESLSNKYFTSFKLKVSMECSSMEDEEEFFSGFTIDMRSLKPILLKDELKEEEGFGAYLIDHYGIKSDCVPIHFFPISGFIKNKTMTLYIYPTSTDADCDEELVINWEDVSMFFKEASALNIGMTN